MAKQQQSSSEAVATAKQAAAKLPGNLQNSKAKKV
jgi:hypothetical protein